MVNAIALPNPNLVRRSVLRSHRLHDRRCHGSGLIDLYDTFEDVVEGLTERGGADSSKEGKDSLKQINSHVITTWHSPRNFANCLSKVPLTSAKSRLQHKLDHPIPKRNNYKRPCPTQNRNSNFRPNTPFSNRM